MPTPTDDERQEWGGPSPKWCDTVDTELQELRKATDDLRRDMPDPFTRQQREKHVDDTLDWLVRSQKAQTAMLRPVADYFAFARVGRKLFLGLAALGAAVVSLIAIIKGLK